MLREFQSRNRVWYHRECANESMLQKYRICECLKNFGRIPLLNRCINICICIIGTVFILWNKYYWFVKVILYYIELLQYILTYSSCETYSVTVTAVVVCWIEYKNRIAIFIINPTYNNNIHNKLFRVIIFAGIFLIMFCIITTHLRHLGSSLYYYYFILQYYYQEFRKNVYPFEGRTAH